MLSWLPENISTFGGRIDHLFALIYSITLAVFLLVEITLVIFLVRYRARAGRPVAYTHGNNTLEVAWTVIPAIILVVLAVLSQRIWAEVKGHVPAGDVRVRVEAKQFNWEVYYPGPDRRFGTADDRHLENDLRVPVNKTVQVTLTSRDVIHSFFLPNLRLKQDAVPGREIAVWFRATKAGRYEIPCAELCGFGHSGMLGWLTVYSPAEYEQWRADTWGPAAIRAEAAVGDRAGEEG